MKTIAILSRKGGSGKSTLSHFLAQGLSHGLPNTLGKDVWTVVLRTDNRTDRPTEMLPQRKYFVSSVPGDHNDGEHIEHVIKWARSNPDTFLIIDGGANRRNYDYVACAVADIVLIPTGPSREDMATSQADYEDFLTFMANNNRNAEIFYIRNRWPGNQKKYEAQMAKKRTKEFIPRWEKEGALFPYMIPEMPSMMDLADVTDPQATILLNKLSTGFAQILATRLKYAPMLEHLEKNNNANQTIMDDQQQLMEDLTELSDSPAVSSQDTADSEKDLQAAE